MKTKKRKLRTPEPVKTECGFCSGSCMSPRTVRGGCEPCPACEGTGLLDLGDAQAMDAAWGDQCGSWFDIDVEVPY